MKKRIKEFMHKKLFKRSVSLVVSAAMFFTSSSAFWDIISKEGLLVVHAAADTYYLTTISEIVEYSKEYAAGNRNPKDILNIAIASSNDPDKTKYQTTTTVYQYDEFVSIGYSGNAFEGEINITVDAISYFNFDKPLFGYVKDSTIITVTGGSSNGYLDLRNPTSGTYKPVLAEHVIHDTNYAPTLESDYNTWKIKVNYFNESGLDPVYANFPSVIGYIDSDCKLALDIINDAVNGSYKRNIEAIAGTDASYANAGLVCGTLGTDAKVIATVSGTNTGYTISSANGDAGSLIGEMMSGSTLKLSGANLTGGDNRTITASKGYAGGLVGKATDCIFEFDNSYLINERITGSKGAGGIAGYYESSTGNAFGLAQANIDCKLTSASAGGLFGVLKSGGDFTLNTPGYNIASSSVSQPNGGYYGGLIGTYMNTALTNTLMIGNVAVTTKGSGNSAGLIGKLDTSDNAVASYVKIDGASVTNSIAASFAGVVNNAGYKGHMIDIGDFTLSSSDFSGAGLVGTMGAGVVRLSGTTDMSSAKCSTAQLVNNRGSALIYALGDGSSGDWLFKRSVAVASDDIGSWGEVLRITSANEYTGASDADTTSGSDTHIVSFDSTAHTVTVQSPTLSIATTNDFIRTALNMQINEGDKGALQFADDTNNSEKLHGSSDSPSSISITADIYLSNTGIMGLMRDDGKRNASHSNTTSDAAFVGTLDGNNHTVTLAIGEAYGMRNDSTLSTPETGNGMLHNHPRCGLLSVTNGATIQNLTIAGTIYTESSNNGMCLGGFVGYSKGDLTLTGIDTTLTFSGKSNDTNAKYFGCLIGKADGDSKTVSISGANHSTLSTNAHSAIYASNSIGYVGDSTITISFSNYTLGDTSSSAAMPSASLSNPSTSTQDNASCGGLIGYINGTSKLKTVNINNTAISHYRLNLTSQDDAGGILGYLWSNAEVNIGNTGTTGLVVSNCAADQATASAGGLVHTATGHWAVSNLNICDTDFCISGVKNYGVLVNKAYSLDNNGDITKALFMELKATSGSGNSFDMSDDVTVTESGTSALTVYDELVAYSAPSDVLSEGNAVVSIHTASGTVVGGKYANQITVPNNLTDNNHTRYYYDLDVIRTAVSSGTYPTGSTAAEQNAYKLMMWNLNQYAHTSIQTYFVSSFADNDVIPDGSYDLSKVSYYPLNRSTSISIGAASFTFNNKNIEDSAVTGSTYRSTTESESQHYLMHCGLFYNVTGNIFITDNLTLAGSIGRHENGSGAIVAGTLGGLTSGTTTFQNTSEKLITLNGLTVNAPDTYTPTGSSTAVNTYKPVLINLIGNHVSLTMNGVNTTNNSYKNGDTINIAGSSLIGTVGTKDDNGNATSDSISLTFNDIRLDARTGSSPDFGATYGTTKSVFTKATLLDEFIFNNNTNCKGVYNYRLAEDWNADGSALHHVTYGYEIDGTAEFEDMQEYYIDRAGKTNPESRASAIAEATYTFSGFLPYVAVRDYDADVATKRSREIMVNHTNVSITQGCGTYNDPYIIDSNGQIEAIAKILELGDMNDGFTINVPKCTNASTADYKGWCGNDHIQLTFDNGTYKAANTTYNHTKQQLAKYLAGAYYKITKASQTTGDGASAVTTYSSISINSTSFNGLGGTSKEYAFRGVIVGDSDTASYPLVNNTGAPLIRTSYGSVVKGLNINVRNTNITLTQENNTQKFVLSGGCSNYGAVIGQILGGDNIIDTVSVNYTDSTINLTGASAKIIPTGGLVGVVESGALVFRGTNSVSDFTVKNNVNNANTTISTADTNWLYVNPIIGRVLNGYAVYEAASNTSSDDYQYDESNVTMKNGTKNYSIADIDPDYEKLEVSAYTQIGTSGKYTTEVEIPNAQSMYVLSLLMQSRTIGNDKYSGSALKVADSDSYTNDSYKMMRHATYEYVGTNNNTDYNSYAKYDCYGLGSVSGIKWAPYLVERFTEPVSNYYYVLSLTNTKTVCNMTLTGDDDDWYLPDGFKGVGYIGYNKKTSDGISLHKFDGGEKTIHLNMSLKHYSVSTDNYPPSTGNVGFGLFSSIRHNNQTQEEIPAVDLATDDYKIKNLNLTGWIDYDVVDISEYSSTNVDKPAYIDVGGFAGYCGFGEANDLRVESIDLSSLTVNGFKTAGGLFGYLNMAKGTGYLAKISGITAADGTLTVTSKQYVGGVVGRAEQIGLTIEDMTIDNLSVLTDNNGKTNYSNGVGGVIGQITNFDSNKNSTFGAVTLNNITIGDEDATTNLRFGYRVNATLVDSNDYNRIAVGGLIGQSKMDNIKNTSEYGLIVSNCYVYNVDFYGHRVGGILGHDSDGTDGGSSRSNISFQNDHVISTNSASINGLTFYNNRQNRGCGGIAGYIKNDDYKVLFEDCSVEGYLLRSYNDTGGLSSNIQSKGSVTLKNVMLKDLQIQSCYHGALFGYLNKPTNGYNVLVDNVQFSKYDNKNYIETKYGYLIGNNATVIKIVGLTRQNVANDDHLNRICGTKNNNAASLTNYGSDGYIIWADTLGNCTATATAGTKQSDLSDTTSVTAKSPWVTVSPSINIGTIDEDDVQVLTGDSIMSNFAAADVLSISTLDDVKNAGTGTAKNAQSTYLKYRNGTDGKPKLFSTYETEMGVGSLPQGVSDFPVIVVDKTGLNDDINNAFNSYVQMLTHTTYNYWKIYDNSTYNYKVKIYRCTYSNGKFENVAGSTGLWLDTSSNKEGFKTDLSHPDTDAQTACFTLVDVQFMNPAATSEVAYHVYVPVLIKKVMTLNFKASSLPGTVYDYTNYITKVNQGDGWGTPSVTNLGTPVTVYFQYEYTSKVSEWQELLDGGDSLMWHTGKKILLTTASQNFPNNTRMVLVDANDNDRAYFAKVTDTGVFTKDPNTSQNDYYLDLDKFSNGSDIFTSVDFGEKLPITASTTERTGAAAYVLADIDDNETVYVYATATIDGVTKKYPFRKYVANDGAKTKYYLTVTGNADDIPAGLTESYYLTFYTDSNNSDSLRVILLGSAAALSSVSEYAEATNHTFRRTNEEVSALILGNVYKQQFTKFETENATQSGLVNVGCNYFESDITVQISVNNDNEEASTIVRYLRNPSIQVYHGILLTLTQNDGTKVDNSIYGTPTYSRNTAKNQTGVYGTISSILENSTVSTEGFAIDEPTNTSSFIKIQDADYDIKPLLIETTGSGDNISYGGAIISILGLRTHFDFLNITNQFPYQVNNNSQIGTTVTAVSVLDSDVSNLAYSNIRESKLDESGIKYHSEQPSSANLVYMVDNSDETEIVKNYNLLGINPIDPLEYRTNVIAADGTYNASTFIDSAEAGKIRWTLSLEKKNENGIYEKVDMSKYLASAITISDRPVGNAFATFMQSGQDYIYDEDYTTPMDITKLSTVYAMKTGTDLEAVTNSEGNPETGVYANYRVVLSASLYTGDESLTGLTAEQLSARLISNSTKSADIRYTNAKVLSSWVNPIS